MTGRRRDSVEVNCACGRRIDLVLRQASKMRLAERAATGKLCLEAMEQREIEQHERQYFLRHVNDVFWQQKVTVRRLGFALLVSSKAFIPIQ